MNMSFHSSQRVARERQMITLRNNTAERHVAELAVDAEADLILGRRLYGLPNVSKIHRQHARIGWRTG